MSQENASLQELLASTGEEDDAHTVECRVCQYMCPEGTTLCPECGETPKLTTLGEQGKRLPLGVEDGDVLNKGFDLVPLTWKIEHQVGRDHQARRRRLNLSDYIGIIMAHTVTALGETDLSGVKLEKKLLIFRRMYMADVFYMYAYLRVLSLGDEMETRDLTCPNCNQNIPKYDFDVSSLEVSAIENAKNLTKEVELRDGFEMAGEIRKKLTIKPPKWSMLAQKDNEVNTARVFANMLAHSVVGIEGLPDGAKLTDKEISQFSKYDMVIAERVMERTMHGPVWTIEGTCPLCENEFFHMINWTYDDFFALSYRSGR